MGREHMGGFNLREHYAAIENELTPWKLNSDFKYRLIEPKEKGKGYPTFSTVLDEYEGVLSVKASCIHTDGTRVNAARFDFTTDEAGHVTGSKYFPIPIWNTWLPATQDGSLVYQYYPGMPDDPEGNLVTLLKWRSLTSKPGREESQVEWVKSYQDYMEMVGQQIGEQVGRYPQPLRSMDILRMALMYLDGGYTVHGKWWPVTAEDVMMRPVLAYRRPQNI